MSLWLIFLTGLTTGGLTCLAVQGGLLAGLIAEREKETLEKKLKNYELILITAAFLISKLITYAILGFLLGLLGSAVQITPKVGAFMQITAGLFMLGTAFRILDIHPFFRNFSISTPKFISKYVRSKSKSTDLFAPILLGILTIFIPCGTTQAMEALAISSGNAFYGLLIMSTFIAGTIPVFFILGVFTTKLSESLHQKFLQFAALAVLILGLLAVDNGLSLVGSPITFSSIKDVIVIDPSGGRYSSTSGKNTVILKDGVQEATITAATYGYVPNEITVKAGIPLKLTFVSDNNYSCSRGVVFPTLGINKILPVTGQETIEFTPQQSGVIPFTCSMGMYRGRIIVN